MKVILQMSLCTYFKKQNVWSFAISFWNIDTFEAILQNLLPFLNYKLEKCQSYPSASLETTTNFNLKQRVWIFAIKVSPCKITFCFRKLFSTETHAKHKESVSKNPEIFLTPDHYYKHTSLEKRFPKATKSMRG